MSTRDERAAEIIGRYLFNAHDAVAAARRRGLDLAIACTILESESGGRNEFGADPTSSIPNSWKDGPVTRWRYKVYKSRRRRFGTQGVGPAQLTSRGLQDEADALGGCWKPLHNMSIGFRFVKNLITAYGEWGGFRAYNGSGPAADAYANHAVERANIWRKRLGRYA